MARTITITGLTVFVMLSMSLGLAQDNREEGETMEEILDRESVRCISAAAIRETDIIDDQTVVFRMRNGDYFLNILSTRCWSLERESRFSFSTPSGRLCNADMINVIQPFGGGSQNTAGCGLRRFFPITQAEAELLGVEENERRGRPQMEVTNPTESEEDADE